MLTSFFKQGFKGLNYTSVQPFSKAHKALAAANRVSHKITHKQTVADAKKLKQYLKSESTANMTKSINRSVLYDKEFKQFLDEYKEKNPELPTIIDLSHYSKDQENLKSMEDLRKEDVMMFEEFRKRKARGLLGVEEMADDIKQPRDEDQISSESVLEEVEKKFLNSYSGEEFVILMMDRDSTTLVTTLNRVNHFRVLLFMGNANGLVSYARGKGNDYGQAMDNAMRNLKENIIAVNLDHFKSFTHGYSAETNGFRIKLWSRPYTRAWGDPLAHLMLQLVGFNNYGFEVHRKRRNYYNLTYTIIKLAVRLRTPTLIAQNFGYKLYYNQFAPSNYSRGFPDMMGARYN